MVGRFSFVSLKPGNGCLLFQQEGALPLHFAAKKGYYKIVKVLLEKGVPVDSLDKV